MSGQAITITTGQGSFDARVFLDEDLVDVTQAVTVTINGRQVHAQVPQASLEAVAESFARTRDPHLTYRFVVN